MLLLPLSLVLAAAPVEGDCVFAGLGKATGSSEVQALTRSFDLTDPASLRPWAHGLAVGRDEAGNVVAVTLYGAQPADDGYGVQSPAPVRFSRPLPLGLQWDFTEERVVALLGAPAAQTPEELAYQLGGVDLRLGFASAKLDRIRAIAKPGIAVTLGTCPTSFADPSDPTELVAALALPAKSKDEGNCLFELLGTKATKEAKKSLGQFVTVRTNQVGVIVELDLQLGATRGKPGFRGQVPLGLPSDSTALAARLEPALYPEWVSLLFVPSLGVEVQFDARQGELRLRRLSAPTSSAAGCRRAAPRPGGGSG